MLDNDLGLDTDNWQRLVNNAEKGVHDDVYVRLLVDGPGGSDSYIYNLAYDANPYCPSLSNPTCGGRYTSGPSLDAGTMRAAGEDTAHPLALTEFISQAIADYPAATNIILALVGHGSGWTANALPAQPSRWGTQVERIGGLLWDDTPGDGGQSRSISTRMLGAALDWVYSNTGRRIDLLYLDACSMGMAEVAYEVRDSVRFMLASSNTDWASLSYDQAMAGIRSNRNSVDIATDWMSREASVLYGSQYPFVLSLYDLGQMSALSSSISSLANALSMTLATDRSLIVATISTTEHYESNYDGAINSQDTYIDLRSFVMRLKALMPNKPAIVNAAQIVSTTLQSVVIRRDFQSGRPWPYPNNEWRWSEAGGVAIYLPLDHGDDAKRALYTTDNLKWAQDTAWDQFVHAYVDGAAEGTRARLAQAELPTCSSTRDCTVKVAEMLPLQPRVFLPVVHR